MRSTTYAAALATALLALPAPAAARTHRHHRRHPAACRKHRHHCKIRRARFVARVDPTFTRAPTDPFTATYTYSADATGVAGGQRIDLAAAGQLPAGVLNFYASTASGQPEGLVCSAQVGGSRTSDDCPVKYSATGTYPVTTQYIPQGAAPVTETDEETISPFSSTTTLIVNQQGCSEAPGRESCTYTLSGSTDAPSGLAFRFSAAGASGYLRPAGVVLGTVDCEVVVEVRSAPNMPFSEVEGIDGAPECLGGAAAPGVAVAGWQTVAQDAGAPGWTPSSSAPLGIYATRLP